MFAAGGLGTLPAWAAARPAPLLSPDPTVAFSAAVYHGFAVAGSLPITVTLSAVAAVTATVDYATSDGSAQAGVDYTALSGTLTFSPGVTSQTLSLPLLNNPLGAADQTLTATLSSPVSATLGAPATALIVIGHDNTTTFTVTKSADTADGACELTDCSLREAVLAANTYPGANTIVLPSGTYTLSLAGANEDAAATGDLDVSGDLTLSGVTSATTIITTTGAAFGDRIFQVMPSVAMTATDITVTGGFLQPGNGGGFYDQGQLALARSTIFSNTAAGQGGALYVYTGTVATVDSSQLISNTSTANFGTGGIYNAGTLTVTNSSIRNTLGVGLQNNQGQFLLIGSLVSNSSNGGLFNVDGTGVISDSTITNNLFGGVANEGAMTTTTRLTVINSSFTGNINSNTQVGGGAIANIAARLAITDSSFISNSAAGSGGGIFSYNGTGIAIWQSTFSDNSDGAIFNLGSGSPTTTLMIEDSLFSNNHATLVNAGITNEADHLIISGTTFTGNASRSVNYPGGAIYNLSWGIGITNSAFYSNTTTGSGGAVVNSAGVAAIANSTFSGNQAADNAGAIWLLDGPDTLKNVTLAGNTASHNHTGVGGGGLAVSSGVVVTTTNTIIAGNFDLGSLAPDCAGALTTGGHNLIQSTTGCALSGTATGDITGTPALLEPVQDNGGPTWTMAVLPGSPALDAGSPAAPGNGGSACEATDQRGVARPQGPACDIGAFEVIVIPVTATVQFANGAFSAAESAGTVPITVTLSQVLPVTVTAQYSTTDGTALAGSDYVSASGTLTFTPGLTQTTFAVTLLASAPGAPDKLFGVAILSPTIAVLGTPPTATVTIHNDAPLPSLAFSRSQYSVTESGGAAVITVTLSTASALAATVHYATSNGTALAGSDYTSASGMLTFTLGLTQTTFSVPITNDALHEANEPFGVALSNPTGASLGAPITATITIVDDDPAPLVRFSSATYSITESGGAAVITVTLSAASGLTATVHYATSNGTATAGSDYTAASGSLTFAPGQVMQVFTVPITNDVLVEGPETVLLTLSAPAQATLGSPGSATLAIVDNVLVYRLYLPMIARP